MATFALVPGAGGSGWYWHRVVPELERRGHRAVALDLPSGDPAADFPAYTDACVRQLRNAGVDIAAGDADIVVVAQSLGGFTAPVLAERVRAARIVLVNAMIPLPHETPGHWFGHSGAGQARRALAAAEGRELGDDIDEMQEFFHDVPDDVVEEAMRQGEPEQSDAIMDCATPFDVWPAPVTVVTGRDDRLFPRDFQVPFAKERLGVDAVVVPGGHLAALSQPAALADAFL
ncbi:alpha/beta fold hydrolase [Gordonia hankookensis]|uniref:Alpha/beta fold hydrolase n=1 Tax=Gordonia hankookensis TaxID=589403 RepID=A0ABR7W6R8_9ACTN|nr:alpha/beta fold hydrolase [Gordonia hankookensis]MBD1318519.1 alpha/beta fold hydrolase [Gordonia hankookensis]